MSVNNAEEEYSSPRSLEAVESPRKRMRMDCSSRKSWSLMDRKTDHEVLQEMGVSLLEPEPEPDDPHAHPDHTHHRPLKRKHNLENVNPNVVASPRRNSPRKACSPGAGPSRHRSPRAGDKAKPLTETNLECSISSECIVDEETPLGQSVSHVSPLALQHRRHNTSVCPEEEPAARGARWEPSGADSFSALSDEVMLGVFRWLPKRSLAHCMLLCKRWYRVARDESLWQRLDLGHKTMTGVGLGRVLDRRPLVLRLAGAEIGEWRPTGPASPCRLQYLDLSMAAIDRTSLNHLLRRCPALRKLSLESLQVDDYTCEMIGKCSQLETLNLTMTSGVTAEGLAHILSGCASLTALNVGWSGLTQPALEVLCTRLPPRLQRLNAAGARALTDDMVSDVCARGAALVELDLSDCPRLTAASVAPLTALPRLHHLALSRCYLLPAAALAKLGAAPALQYLEVWGMLPAAALAALRAALARPALNEYMFSAIARPTVGTRRTSIWGLRTRD